MAAFPLAGLPLRYLIGKSNDTGESGAATEVGYDATTKPGLGIASFYANARQEEKGRKPGIDYIDPPDDIEEEYGEPAPVFGTAYFWQNLATQWRKWKALGFTLGEIDNLDTYTVPQADQMLDAAVQEGLRVLVKNPHMVGGGDPVSLLRHAGCAGLIIEESDTTAKKLDDMRRAAGKPDLSIRVVSYEEEGRAWADKIAAEATALGLLDFGVTNSPSGEYETHFNIMRPALASSPPDSPPVPPIVISGTPWVKEMREDLGPPPRYKDGSDVPMLAARVGRAFPSHAKYAAQAGPSTAWCGIYIADKMARFGIEPPLADFGVGGWMYVDAWEPFGTPVASGAEKVGDIALFEYSDLHHIAFISSVSPRRYIGGNQSNTVTETAFSKAPHFVRRAPPVENYVVQPTDMPMLMIQSTGDAVVVLQKMLNAQGASPQLEEDGDFGALTEQAVKTYQSARGLEVDGIVGQQTWTALFEGMSPLPPTDYHPLTAQEIADVCAMAERSAIATYAWQDRGRAPIGYTQGMAVMFAQSLRKLIARDSSAVAMAAPIGANSKDALAYYGIVASGDENVLRKAFVMLYGLGMRESSGNYTEGRDMTASNVTANTAEAGLFQQSWNSAAASPEMPKLLDRYEAGSEPSFAEIFKRGITIKDTQSYGTGDGRQFQDLAKSCPAFATDMCAVGVRVLYNHWGPIVRQEVEIRAEAEALLAQVATYIKAAPEPEPEPPLPVDSIVAAVDQCKAATDAAIDKLTRDLVTLLAPNAAPTPTDSSVT
jgi:peptidoglycan hydrolase-like protein with peptidoglycan-binding domain